ncbi:hypothetical protein PPL_03846 [Heterostelium album PN500]|uniref:Uncharacterized protein n=1 Tax=Heterostelium pallidum (strain ATCC 26659 / Pp 5 / PN500) TaxID=670386 RepID=D3B6T8_HETP5|nr:hypothetical protein PPL_03846 [Heterostelium album PN500]EFA83058.1 hypothetical protein PPL_03846 [Heterostelium album PN500]|eukprot:XP_020435175.1 hypothetical protein PPL_03846 [Heterostelium album PN500]
MDRESNTPAKKSFSSKIKSIFQLPNSVKGKMVGIANVTFFSLRYVLNAAWVLGTLVIIFSTPMIRCIEYERLVRATDKKREAESNQTQGKIAQTLPRVLNE